MFSILLHSLLLLLAWCPSAFGHLQAICSSGMNVSNVQTMVIEITGTLSNNSYLQLSCVLKLDKPGSFLRMKTKRNDNEKGEGITSLIEWLYRLLRERSFVDVWFNEDTTSLFLYWFNFLIILYWSESDFENSESDNYCQFRILQLFLKQFAVCTDKGSFFRDVQLKLLLNPVPLMHSSGGCFLRRIFISENYS